MTPDQIVAQAEEQGLQLVRFLYCDNGGVIRGKSTHVGQLARRMQSGIGLVKGMQSFTSLDTLAPDATYGPVGEIRLVPDPETFVVLPYAPAQRPDGRQHGRAGPSRRGRSTRARSCSGWSPRAADAGPRLRRGLRERVLPRRPDRRRLPAGRPEPVLQRDRHGIDRGGHPGHHRGARPTRASPSSCRIPELGCGPAGAVDPARPGAPRRRQPDHLPPDRPRRRRPARPGRVARAEAVRRPGRQRRPPPLEHLGHGPHDEPAGGRARARTASAALARNAIAGVLAHLPGLLGLTTPSVNSFRRLQPHYWSSAYTAWGIENREAAVRVPSRYWDDEAGSTNLELKASDASANPYIALGGVIAAALDGIERGLDPGEPVDEDPGNLTDAERAARGHPALPGDRGRGARRAREGRGPDGRARASRWRRSTSRSAAPRPPRTPSRTTAFELEQHFFKY